MPDLVHGTVSSYTNHGCRCDLCKRAHADAKRAHRAELVERGKVDPSLIPHGTEAGYHEWGCRGEECRKAWSDAARRRRERRKAEAMAA
jgi:hypothetical protein